MKRHPWFLFLSIILMILLASCGGSKQPSEPVTSDNPVVSKVETEAPPTSEETKEVETESSVRLIQPGGAGDFELRELMVGLSALVSYRQSVEVQFEGTKDGMPFSSNTVISQTVTTQPSAQSAVIQTVDQDGTPVQITSASIGGAAYFQDGPEMPCQGSVPQEGVDSGMIPDPASLLPMVFGAEKASEETVNGVAAAVYAFDENALAAFRGGSATGKLWIAVDGGYLVKYTLEIQAPVDVLGLGMAGKQVWTYNLTDVNAVSEVELPLGCTPVLIDFPVSPQAQNIERMSGSLHYFTNESVEQVSSFYREQLTAQGWSEKDMFESTGEKGMLSFRAISGDRQKTASIVVRATEGQTEVIAVVFDEEVPEVTSTSVP